MKNNLGLLIQAVLGIVIVPVFLIYLFEKSFLPLLQILLILFMFTAAFNNQKYFKRKYMTIIYMISGIAFLGALIIG